MSGQQDIVFGIKPVMEAIHAGKHIDKVLVQQGVGNAARADLLELLRTHRISVQLVPLQKLNSVTRKNHQGVVAFISPVPFHSIEQLLPGLFEKGETPFLLILDGITDVRNFGAIIRSAECAGVHAVIIPAKGAAQVSSDAIKTSAGAIFNMKICKEPSLKHAVQFLQQSGVQVVGCTEKTDQLLYEPDFSLPTALIMGSEDQGISNDLLRNADHLAAIPLKGTIESLNVSVAAGIMLYEVVRKRTQSSN